jgi:hypothetical protein
MPSPEGAAAGADSGEGMLVVAQNAQTTGSCSAPPGKGAPHVGQRRTLRAGELIRRAYHAC